jgi:iron complex outermembrane receptor protein
VLARAKLASSLAASAAAFWSKRDVLNDYSELFSETQPGGAARELVIADPPQRRLSYGGEANLSWTGTEGGRAHRLRTRFTVRLRDSRIGGSSPPVDLGERLVGVPTPTERPLFESGPQLHDGVRHWTAGLSYEGRWQNVGELTAGLQRAAYTKSVDAANLPRSTTQADPWLVNAAVAVYAMNELAFYAGFTRGLEETGIAPANAANRNQLLGAIITRQIDAGIRYSATETLRLVAGVFDVRKPNFALDAQGMFTELGEVQHQGIELSLAGELVDGLAVVAGAVLMRPRVSGPPVDNGQIGPLPVGQTARTVRMNLNYDVQQLRGLSVDLGMLNVGERVASSDNLVSAPGTTTVDLGGRYRLSAWGQAATLRLQLKNLMNVYGWRVMGSNAYRTNSPRAASASIAIDF